MSFPYEGPSDALRLRIRPPSHKLERIDDLPMKQKADAKGTVRKNRTVPKATWEKRKAAAEQKVNHVQSKQKQPSILQGGSYKESQHPRDRFGRFAVKAIKTTGKAIKGTVKGVKSVHQTVKRINADQRRRDALAHRERKLDLHKRERAAGLKRSRTTRRSKAAPQKKQGGLFGFLGGSQKKQRRR